MSSRDFSKMSGAELVDAYNSLAGLTGQAPRTSKFSSKSEGVLRCQELQVRVDAMAPTPPAPKTSLKHQKIIRLLVGGNPRRPGTDAHRHFEAMVGSPTVGQYLDKFEATDRACAARWLWNTVRDGYAELLG
jgi:hypothetical protein